MAFMAGLVDTYGAAAGFMAEDDQKTLARAPRAPRRLNCRVKHAKSEIEVRPVSRCALGPVSRCALGGGTHVKLC